MRINMTAFAYGINWLTKNVRSYIMDIDVLFESYYESR